MMAARAPSRVLGGHRPYTRADVQTVVGPARSARHRRGRPRCGLGRSRDVRTDTVTFAGRRAVDAGDGRPTAAATRPRPDTQVRARPPRRPPPAATPPPRASGPPRLAYAAFLRRVNDDRATVERLNGALSTAAQAQDPAAVRHAAVDILDFVDAERDWLRDHPPADCYAAAHASAGAMLDAYGAAADAFIAWAETGGGFAGLSALGKALDAAQAASDALTASVTRSRRRRARHDRRSRRRPSGT